MRDFDSDYYDGLGTRWKARDERLNDLVDEFLIAMDVRSNPDCFALQLKLLKEEIDELDEAYWAYYSPEEWPGVDVFEHFLKEYGDVFFIVHTLNLLGDAFSEDHEWEEFEKLADAVGDGSECEAFDLYLHQSGYEDAYEDIIKEITRSNLSKLDDNGKPIRRDDGKVLKGPNYSPANMKPIAQKLLRTQ